MSSFFYEIRLFFRKAYRIFVGVFSAFSDNNDYLKASALTYYTLISIVPFLAVAFGIASGFGFAEYLENQLVSTFEEQHEVVAYSIQFARSLLQNVQGSIIAGIGLVFLLWTVFSLLYNIESALNEIWKVRKHRSWLEKTADYLAVMIAGPIFFVVSSSLSVYLLTQITQTAKDNYIIGWVSPYLEFLLRLVPMLLSILLFVMIYLFIPYAKLQRRPRIIAGVIAGIAFQLWQWFYIKFQVEISSYGAIYGTFAALPLFLLWLQASWLILLAGAELAAHLENEMSFKDLPDDAVLISERQIALLVVDRCIEAFHHAEQPPSAFHIANDLGIPFLTVQQILDLLEEEGIVVEVALKSGSTGYLISKEANIINLKEVCDAVTPDLKWSIPVENSSKVQKITKYLDHFDRSIEKSPANVSMRKG